MFCMWIKTNIYQREAKGRTKNRVCRNGTNSKQGVSQVNMRIDEECHIRKRDSFYNKRSRNKKGLQAMHIIQTLEIPALFIYEPQCYSDSRPTA
mgnify:CR=1 FL=1